MNYSDSPTNSRSVRVREVADSIQYGHTASAVASGKGPRFLRITDIQNGAVDWNSVPSCDIAEEEIPKYRLSEGDLVFARTGATTGKSYLIRKCPDAVFASYLIRVRASKDVDPRYLAFFFQSPDYWRQIEEGKRGIGQPNVNGKTLGEVRLPLPPRDKQQRIVAEIEKQFTRLDAGVASLKRVQAALKRYRASVLKAACEGRLVPTEAELARLSACNAQAGKENRSLPAPRPGTFYVYAIRCDNDSIYIGQTDDLQRRWNEHVTGQACDWTRCHRPLFVAHYEEYSSREAAVEREKWLKTGFGRKWLKREIAAGRARQAGYETGEQLLQRILKERREKWSGKGKYKEPALPNVVGPTKLTEGWTWATLDQLAAPERNSITDGPFGSNLKTEHYTKSGPRVIRLQNIGDGRFIKEEAHISEKHFENLQKHRVFPNDLVIAALGENPPRSCLIPESLGPAIVKADCIRFKPHNLVAPKYLNFALNSDPVRKRTKKIVHGVGRPRLNLREIKSILIPIPPLSEQRRIVVEVERRLTVIEKLQTSLYIEFQRSAKLRRSVLQRAFDERLADEL